MVSILVTIVRSEISETNVRYENIDVAKFDSHLHYIAKDVERNWLGRLVNVKVETRNDSKGEWELDPELTVQARSWLKPIGDEK